MNLSNLINVNKKFAKLYLAVNVLNILTHICVYWSQNDTQHIYFI